MFSRIPFSLNLCISDPVLKRAVVKTSFSRGKFDKETVRVGERSFAFEAEDVVSSTSEIISKKGLVKVDQIQRKGQD